MFDNEKIYINEIKTVIHTVSRTEKTITPKFTTIFGIAASVYGKLLNCYFGGSYPYRTYAVTQPIKATMLSDCFYSNSCKSLYCEGVKDIDSGVSTSAEKLNNGINNAKKVIKELPFELVKWEYDGTNPILCRKEFANIPENGNGSRENPFIIRTANDFIDFTNKLNNCEDFEGKYFRQICDIDLSSRTDYNGAIGSGFPCIFKGIYDGCGHVINIALDTTSTRCNNTVFPYTDGTIMNLGITGTIISCGQYVSGFARSIQKHGTIINCYSLVKISTTLPADLNYELRYYISGKSKIEYKNESLNLNSGSVLYIPKRPGISEEYFENIDEPINSISIYFNTSFPLVNEIFVCNLSENKEKEMEYLFNRMYITWLSRKSKYYLNCMAIIYEIIARLSKHTGNYIPVNKYTKIERGVAYLFSNCFNKDIDFYYPCELCGISYTYFKQLFIQKFEKSPKQYITSLRMERAVELLNIGSCSITEVAKRCGYENVYYFSKAFKKYYGVSPKNYFSK